ncbi:hypothetical protein [Agrobacterium sp. El2ro-1b]
METALRKRRGFPFERGWRNARGLKRDDAFGVRDYLTICFMGENGAAREI